MRTIDKISNFYYDALEFILRYLPVFTIILGLIVSFIMLRIIDINSIDFSSIPGVSSSFAGFLLTCYAVMVNGLPNNSFTKLLKDNPIYKSVLGLVIVSGILQFLTTIISIININKHVTFAIFVVATVETFFAFAYVFKAFYYSTSKSKDNKDLYS